LTKVGLKLLRRKRKTPLTPALSPRERELKTKSGEA